jgi:hypothetical protein
MAFPTPATGFQNAAQLRGPRQITTTSQTSPAPQMMASKSEGCHTTIKAVVKISSR